MADTTFSAGTTVASSWLNDVNRATYKRQIFDVKSSTYGAVGDGTTDDTTAIQAAITAAMVNGGIVYFPAGTYKITSTLNIKNSAASKKSGVWFVGQGMQSTTIKSYCTSNNNPLFRIRGVPTSGPSGTYFWWGGGFSNLYLDGTNATATGHDAIECLGWWNGTIENTYITSFSGNGINSIVDLVYDANPDWSACNGVMVRNCFITYCTGYAAKGSYIGSPAWMFKNTIFGPFNQGGGVQWYSAGLVLDGCSFSACGFIDSTHAAAGTKYSLEIGSASLAGAINIFDVIGCEFDTAKSAHVLIQNVNGALFRNNRFIFNDRYASGFLTPLTGVTICPNNASDSAKLIRFIDNNWRFDTAGTATKYNFANVANVNDITIQDGASSNGGGATITSYTGYTTSNMHYRQNYIITENGTIVSTGKPSPYVLASTTSGSITATPATIVFGTVETVCNQVYSSTYYNSGTGVFTAPYTGYYDISYELNITSLAAADFLQTYIYINGSLSVERDFNGSGLTHTTVGVKERIYVTAGQTIDIRAANTNTRSIASASLNIQLV